MSNSLWPHGLTTACQASLSFTISQSVSKFKSIASGMPSSLLILWCPLLLLPSIFPSISDFSNKSAVHIRWPKYESFSYSISPSNEYSGLISLKIPLRFDLLAVQGSLRSLLQNHSWKASLLWHCALYPGGNTWGLSQRPLWGDCASEKKGNFRRCRVPGVDFNPLLLYDDDTY